MKQRSMILALMAMIPFAVSVAQTPPTPPAQPTPATPVIVPAPGQRPLMPLTPVTPLPGEPIYIDREEIRRAVEDAKWQGQLAAEEGRRMAEQGKWLAEDVRRLAEDAKWQAKVHLEDLKFDFNKDFKFDFNHDFKFDFDHDFKFDFDHDFKFEFDHDMKLDLKIDPKISMKAPNFAFTPMPGQNGATLWTPQLRQYQDPADSMYQLAREMISRQDYSRAAAKFGEMIAKYPGSRYAVGAAYYQAFALYRVGTLDALRSSLKILEANAQAFQYSNSSYRNDAPSLHARVLRALAERNESGADAKLRDLIAKYPSERCDKDKIDIQATLLNSLYQTDPEAAAPYIKQWLETRDACTAKLRMSAIYLLANRGSEANTNQIVQLAKNDTVRSVRLQAIEVLSRMPGEAAINALQQFMADDDEAIQRAAVRSLMRSDNPRARAAMRMSVIDKREAPERQRIEAINSLTDNNMTQDDAVYLRGLFKRQGESDRIKDAIVSAIGRMPNDENLKFLMDVAQDPNESSSIRANALRRVTARQNLSTDNLIKLYDATDNRSMRNSLVDALAQRPEQAALNKLLDIVKSSTDPEVRSNAIQELLRKNDKAITQRVLDLIGKPTGGL
jgi:HEAT repeat protein